MKENIIYFRKGTITHTGFIGRKPQNSISKMYKIMVNNNKPFLRATEGVSVDTGYIWNSNNVKMEICFKNLEKRYATIFGAEDTQNLTESGKYSLIGHTLNTSDLKFGWYVGKQPSLGSSASLSFTDKIHTMSIETNESTSQIICTVDGNTQTFTNSNAVIVNKTITNSIFSSHFQTYRGQFAPCDVYYCKMWDNGVLVRNLYPAKANVMIDKKTPTVDCMYDYVTKTFYPNVTGNGTLTYYDE